MTDTTSSAPVSPAVAAAIPSAGAVFRVIYPFTKSDFETYDGNGPVTVKTWRPGISMESTGYGDVDIWADSEGEMVLTVVATFKPGRFPTRVFYQRSFIDPDGRLFGKTRLLISTLEKFRRISARYQFVYDVEETFDEAAERRAQGISAGTAETPSAAQGEAREPGAGTACAQGPLA